MFFSAPRVVVGDFEGGGIAWEFCRESGEDEEVAFDGEPGFGPGAGG